MIERLNYMSLNGAAVAAWMKAQSHMSSLDVGLRAIVETRISQINGCAYCVDVHLQQARAAGETQQRLDCLAVWEESPFFTEAERAALAWAEAVTQIADEGAPDALYDALRAHFSDQEVVDLTMIIGQMNAWNRVAISFRHMPATRTE